MNIPIYLNQGRKTIYVNREQHVVWLIGGFFFFFFSKRRNTYCNQYPTCLYYMNAKVLVSWYFWYSVDSLCFQNSAHYLEFVNENRNRDQIKRGMEANIWEGCFFACFFGVFLGFFLRNVI